MLVYVIFMNFFQNVMSMLLLCLDRILNHAILIIQVKCDIFYIIMFFLNEGKNEIKKKL